MFFQMISTIILVILAAAMAYNWILKPMFKTPEEENLDEDAIVELNNKISELKKKKKELELVREEIDVTAQLQEINRLLDEKYEQLDKLEKGND